MQRNTNAAALSKSDLHALCTSRSRQDISTAEGHCIVLPINPDASMALTMCKDHQAVYEVCLDEWSDILKSHPRFANWMEDVDAYICNTADLAAMIDHAPTLTVRHVLREAVYCRQQLADRMGNQFATNVEEQATFDRVTAEWHSALIVHPAFASWLATIDRFNCERTILIEAMQRAPSQEIRQALRETYCFRETTSLISGRPFI